MHTEFKAVDYIIQDMKKESKNVLGIVLRVSGQGKQQNYIQNIC